MKLLKICQKKHKSVITNSKVVHDYYLCQRNSLLGILAYSKLVTLFGVYIQKAQYQNTVFKIKFYNIFTQFPESTDVYEPVKVVFPTLVIILDARADSESA